MTIEPALAHPLKSIRFPQEIDLVVDGLLQARLDWRAGHARNAEHGVYFPSRQALQRIGRELAVALFPLRLGPPELTAENENRYVAATLESTLSQLGAQIRLERGYHQPDSDHTAIAVDVDHILSVFAANLPDIRRLLDSDVEAGYAADPAARSVDEVLLAYPSLTAVIHHRIAHAIHGLGAPLVARVVAEIAHEKTGIDIHPGARIGRSFFIDHGTGVVIGETTIIGDRVRLYQGVTLGGDPDIPVGQDRRSARHPIVEDDVVIHANASVIGRVTIGARSRIGGNLWLRQDVPADSIVEAPAPAIRSISDQSDPTFVDAARICLSGCDPVIQRRDGVGCASAFRSARHESGGLRIEWLDSVRVVTRRQDPAIWGSKQPAGSLGAIIHCFRLRPCQTGWTSPARRYGMSSSPSSSLVLTDELKALINNALADGAPLLLAAVSPDGKPVLSFRGSVQTRGDDQFGLWIRNGQGGTLDAIRGNPNVALIYRSATTPVLQFRGRARVAEDDQERSQVFEHAPERERNADPERKGVAVIVDLDRIEGVLKIGPDGPVFVRLAR